MALDQIVCTKCHRVLKVNDFYKSNKIERYADTEGYIPECKNCFCLHVDNWSPETYKPLLEQLDMPYIPDEWNKLLSKYAQKAKTSRTAIIGRYISKMRMNQFSNYRWADNDFLKQKREMEIRTTMAAQGFSEPEIETAINQGYIPTPERPADDEEIFATARAQREPETDYGLTEDDRVYLRTKWGSTYKESEWVQMEQLYNDFTNSYDIQTAGHRDTLKMLCKTSLKANQLLDIGDIDGYQKAQKAYDSLMRSGNFTAAQNKAATGEYVDSISEIVAICEREGFIPRYYIEQPNDRIDLVLRDMENWTKDLVMNEANLSNMIEQAVKLIEQDKEREDAADDGTVSEEEELLSLFDESPGQQLTDEDYEEFNALAEEMAAHDLEV